MNARKKGTSSWLSYHQEKPQSTLRLFCFPYAGGGASIYRTWSEQLSEEIEVCPVQLPGRESRFLEAPYTNVSALVKDLTNALLPLLDRPYAFFGHSMGALISFELAHSIRNRQGTEPRHLFVSAHRAPCIERFDRAFHLLPDDELIEIVRRLANTPDDLLQNQEFLPILLTRMRADFTVCATYEYQTTDVLRCPITVFGGKQDPEVSENELLSWQAMTTGAFVCQQFVGQHFFLHEQEPSLLHQLETVLLPKQYSTQLYV